MAELQKVDDWLSALLANLEPASRSRMMRQLAQELRRTQQQNIRMQRNPDGSSYEPRRVTARSKKGRIKRQMFAKLRTTKYLKTAASADSASVQFEGKVQRIARVHHYGLRDRVSRKGPEVRFLPYLAWAFSVDRWDEGWTESVKRQVVKDAFYIHQHKGTTSAVRRVVEPFGFLIRIIEWWQTGETPGTFRLDIGVQDQGITEDTYLELERLISDAKPCSRHMIGMSINLQTSGPHWVGAASYLGEEITIYPYINETIISGGTAHEGGAVHVIDTMRVNP